MGIRVAAAVERVRTSLFFVPLVFVVLGVGLALGVLELDREVDGLRRLPLVLTSTVDGAREVLSVVASATMTVAGIAFSVSLLVIQQASSQFSPRVIQSLFRDPFNRRVMGLAVGTFSYCLVVLRSVRGPLDEGGESVIPNLAVAVSVLLGVVAILAVVAFIDHNAHTMEVSQIVERVSADAIGHLEEGARARPASGSDGDVPEPPGPGHVVAFERSGWLQQVDAARLLELVPDGGTVRLDVDTGRFALVGTPLCTLWPAPDDPEGARRQAARAVRVGAVRTMPQDPGAGLRQLADVALMALSPGVNDPTTAQEAIYHLAAVLREALVRDLTPALEQDDRGRRLLRPHRHTSETLIELAFAEVRRASEELPAVSVYVIEALHLVETAVRATGRTDGCEQLRAQARLVLAGAERADLLPADLTTVRAAHRRCFP